MGLRVNHKIFLLWMFVGFWPILAQADDTEQEIFRIQVQSVSASVPLVEEPLSDGSFQMKGFGEGRALRITTDGAILEIQNSQDQDLNLKIQMDIGM